MIELLVVIVILGMLATAVSVSARGLITDQVLSADLQRLRSIDAFAREKVRSGGAGDLVFNIQNNSVVFEPESLNNEGDQIQFDRQFRSDMVSIITPGFALNRQNTIPVKASGVTPTYAVVFMQDQRQTVLMFAGGSGYATIVEDISDVPYIH